MRDTLHAFRLALRALVRAPAFTGAAVVALALGIGGSTVVFSVVNTLLLQPLPYADPGRLVVCDPGPPWALYEQWRNADVFEGLAVYNERAANVSEAGEPERVIMARVTPNFLPVVGVAPAIGRGFEPGQLEAGTDKMVLLTDAFWRRHFGGARDVLGRTLRIDDQLYTVVGVLPRQFKTLTQLMPAVGLSFDSDAAVLVPLLRDPLRREPGSTDLFWRGMKIVGRLRAGVTLDQARAAADTIAKGVKLPAYLAGRSFTLVPVTDFLEGELPAQMAILMTAVGLLLLVAGANVANLLLARGTARQREMATRAALGASGAQLVRHALTETVVLALAGGALGMAGAWGGVRAVAVFGGPVLVRLDAVGLDLQVLFFTCLLSVAVGLLVGIVPALRLAHAAPAAALQIGRGYERVRGGIRLSSALVVGEVVLSLVLVVGAGLLARDLARLASADLGFRSEGVLTADVSLGRTQYREAAAGDRVLLGPAGAGRRPAGGSGGGAVERGPGRIGRHVGEHAGRGADARSECRGTGRAGAGRPRVRAGRWWHVLPNPVRAHAGGPPAGRARRRRQRARRRRQRGLRPQSTGTTRARLWGAACCSAGTSPSSASQATCATWPPPGPR